MNLLILKFFKEIYFALASHAFEQLTSSLQTGSLRLQQERVRLVDVGIDNLSGFAAGISPGLRGERGVRYTLYSRQDCKNVTKMRPARPFLPWPLFVLPYIAMPTSSIFAMPPSGGMAYLCFYSTLIAFLLLSTCVTGSKETPRKWKDEQDDYWFHFVTRPDIHVPKYEVHIYDKEAIAPGK